MLSHERSRHATVRWDSEREGDILLTCEQCDTEFDSSAARSHDRIQRQCYHRCRLLMKAAWLTATCCVAVVSSAHMHMQVLMADLSEIVADTSGKVDRRGQYRIFSDLPC